MKKNIFIVVSLSYLGTKKSDLLMSVYVMVAKIRKPKADYNI